MRQFTPPPGGVIGISHSARPFILIGGHEPAPFALYSLKFTASGHAVKRRSALTDMNLTLCERIANARKGNGLLLHETQDESIASAKPMCDTNKS